MTQDYKHPIAPPPQWQVDGWQARIETMGADVPSILLEVIQWGREQAETDTESKLQKAADRELEACCEWLNTYGYKYASGPMRNDRRPKPPSLKEEALEELDAAILRGDCFSTSIAKDIIRRALKSIPDPS